MKLSKSYFNPALGMLPLIVSMVANFFYAYPTAFLAGVIAFFVLYFMSNLILNSKPSYMLLAVGLAYLLYSLFSFISIFRDLYMRYSVVFCEISLILIFSLADMFRDQLQKTIKAKDKIQEAQKLTNFNEFLHVAVLYKNVIIIHLLIILVYNLLPEEMHSPYRDFYIIFILLIFLILLVILYEHIRLILLTKSIASEEWLPIVNETGGVIGKVTSGTSQSFPKKYLHPIIRIVLTHKGRLYLRERTVGFIIDQGKIDYPLEKYVFYDHSLEDTIGNLLEKETGVRSLPVKFIFRYLSKNQTSQQLIYLYTCPIQSEKLMSSLKLKGGKLWSETQIEENLDKKIFSECFEKEYEVLKNTVLMAEKLVNGELQ